MSEFLHSTDLKDQLLVVNEGGGGKRGGERGRMEDLMKDLQGEWRDQGENIRIF